MYNNFVNVIIKPPDLPAGYTAITSRADPVGYTHLHNIIIIQICVIILWIGILGYMTFPHAYLLR